MVSRIGTVAFEGFRVVDVDVQVQMSSGLPAFTIVGLPDKAVAESRERVRAALHTMGLALPSKRITINLSPADLTKEGSHYDLPIALGLLASMEVIAGEALGGFVALGELGLDGTLAPVSGILAAAIHANGTDRSLICPEKQGSEAAWTGNDSIIAPVNLIALVNHFKGSCPLASPIPPEAGSWTSPPPALDMREIKGQETAKRALEIAAAGSHNMLMTGPPGAGKSMLAARIPDLLPPLDSLEMLETSMIHSLAGILPATGLVTQRPFRDPHHTASPAALIGGGLRARPGEISLAHNGVLFLDELPEFNRHALEALRQPIETGRAVIARANLHVEYPARFQLIAAMNPCRCGYLDSPGQKGCSQAPRCGETYQSKISGPMFDRIDLHVHVPALMPSELMMPPSGDSTATIARRIIQARDIQRQRYGDPKTSDYRTNAEVNGDMLNKVATPDDEGRKLLLLAAERFNLSARGYARILRVSRTIADLDGSEAVRHRHIAEALAFRHLSRTTKKPLQLVKTG